MKKVTIFIYDTVEAEVKFFVEQGDWSHIDGTYINGSDDEEKIDQLNVLLFDKDWKFRVNFTSSFPTDQFKLYDIDEISVVKVGFIP